MLLLSNGFHKERTFTYYKYNAVGILISIVHDQLPAL
jgi:hypothetical protein